MKINKNIYGIFLNTGILVLITYEQRLSQKKKKKTKQKNEQKIDRAK